MYTKLSISENGNVAEIVIHFVEFLSYIKTLENQ